MSLFRSEPVLRYQLILQSEAAYQCVAELGEIEAVQFLDSNPEMSAFQRKYVAEVKRCEELERILRYIKREAIKEGIIPIDQEDEPSTPNMRAIAELEADLQQSEKTLSDLTTNFNALRKSEMELTELKHVLTFADQFLKEESGQTNIANGDIDHENQLSSMKFNVTAGVIDFSKLNSFERILWRISKGNIFLKHSNIDENLVDPTTGDEVRKSIFLLFFQGEELKSRVKKVCEGYHASIYPCPESLGERREMLAGVEARLEDLDRVLKETNSHRQSFLTDKVQSLNKWIIQVRKMKATFHCLNLFNFDVTAEAMVAECWMPLYDIPQIKEVLANAAREAGSTMEPILNEIAVDDMPPTYNRVNKYTAGFQHLVDAYGPNSYREVNPAVYTIATFPFLFAVMFGDAGHGVIMLAFALFLVFKEDSLAKKAGSNEIFNIFFGGRYIITLMGFFSIYTGLIYNDIFSKSFNIFGSHWAFREEIFDNETQSINLGKTIMLDPGNSSQYKRDPYVFGVDPAWQAASNKIIFLNGYKMKISLIFGLIHMVFGVTLSAWQKVLKRKYAEIFVEFIPQLVFLVFIFCYLIFLIFFKWVSYEANVDLHGHPDNDRSEHCAPNLLITFINMMLFKGGGDADPALVDLCHGNETYMFTGQGTLQKFLVVTGVLMVPIMLFGKPILFIINRRRMAQRPATDGERLLGDAGEDIISQQGSNDGGEHGDDNLGEVFIYQGIHTIEYVLGSVSHTASYLRLWALSLAHSQLSEVLWNMVMKMAFKSDFSGVIWLYIIFAAWAFLTLSILVLMEGLSAFLHTLRLHWVEFQSKFYEGQGVLFHPFSFDKILKENAESEGSSAN